MKTWRSVGTGFGTVAWLLLAATVGAETADVRIPALAWTPRSDWINVKSKGAVGDGRADDTAALQSLLNSVNNGVTFYFPPGTYRITKMLTMTGPRLGVVWIGHGRDTRLRWDGEASGRMFKEDGFAHGTRYEGLVFDGAGKAAVGFWHYSDHRFETEVLHRHMAFRGFTQAGIYVEPQPNDKYSTAEIVFENCLFEDCGVGISFTSWNDYNYTIAGCEFRRCGVGVRCHHGNFYIRNTHFEQSREIDIESSAPEHGCSVRRVTSWGSKAFLRHASYVSPITIEDCQVGAWTGQAGAVSVSGAPVLLFDCVFSQPPDKNPPVRLPGNEQPMLVSENSLTGGGAILGGNTNRVRVIAAGSRRGNLSSPRTRFLNATWPVPGKVFDACRDFGAKGDGTTDDTAALQKTIEAARAHGQNALAYLPRGDYAIGQTLRMEGQNYTVGGCGRFSRLLWRGAANGVMMAVNNPQNLRLEHIIIGHHDSGFFSNAVDVLQTATGPSLMTYEAVVAFGMYQKKPFEKGFVFERLDEQAVVLLKQVNGNMRFTDCGRATILAPVSYEGSLVVEGRDPRRGGFLGFQTRLATVVTRGLYLRDNHSLVMSDFFSEQSEDGYLIEGSKGLPPGRVTIQGPKLHLEKQKVPPVHCFDIREYAGEIFLGPIQFYLEPKPAAVVHQGTNSLALAVIASSFYSTRPDWRLGSSVRLIRAANCGVALESDGKTTRQVPNQDLTDNATADDLRALSRALDDLRRLGELDLRLNHPEALAHSAARNLPTAPPSKSK